MECSLIETTSTEIILALNGLWAVNATYDILLDICKNVCQALYTCLSFAKSQKLATYPLPR